MQGIRRIISDLAVKSGKKTFTVAVEGNVGSGKTTFLENFRKNDKFCVLSEPVDDWRDVNEHNLLGLVYKDPHQWSFTFQSYVQLTMMQNHQKPTLHPIKLMERSIYSARYCFVEKLAKEGVLPPPSKSVLDRWFQWILKQNLAPLDLIVYLRTSPEVVFERILQRNRPEEANVKFAAIETLHQLHEDWLYKKCSFPCPAPTLVLNANLDREEIEGEEVSRKIVHELPVGFSLF